MSKKNQNHIRITTGQRVFRVVNVTLLLLLCLLILYPYLNVLAVSFNDSAKAPSSGVMLVPKAWTLSNYTALLNGKGIGRAFAISFIRVFAAVLLGLAVNFTCAYALTRKGLHGRKFLSMYCFIPSYISGGLIPSYILYSSLKVLNNPLVYILPGAFSFYYFMLLRTSIYDIPDGLYESAMLDGASELRIMLQIYLPLCKPILATIALFIVVAHWNDYTSTLYFMTNNKWNTIAYELYRVLNESERINAMIQEAIMAGQIPTATARTSDGLRNAQIIVSTIPILVAYGGRLRHDRRYHQQRAAQDRGGDRGTGASAPAGEEALCAGKALSSR